MFRTQIRTQDSLIVSVESPPPGDAKPKEGPVEGPVVLERRYPSWEHKPPKSYREE